VPVTQKQRSVPWTKAGIAAAVLALLAAGLGLLVAVVQAVEARDMLLDGSHFEARVIKLAIRLHVDQKLTASLRDIAVSEGSAQSRPASDVDWLGPAVIFDGIEFARRPSSGDASVRVPAPPIERLLEQRARAQWERATSITAGDDRPSYHSAESNGQALVIAELVALEPRGGRRSVAALVDTAKLRQDIVAPVLKGRPRLELIESAGVNRAWLEPLDEPLRFWSLAPTSAFVAELNRSVRRQITIQALITLLPLAALLGVMWALARVARREMALSQLKSAFVADVSHELKTPLALIRMFGETLLSERVASPDKAREYYAIITRESTRLTHLIDNLLDFSRIDAGRRLYKPRPVDIAQVVRDTYEAYRHELDREHFEHHLRLAENLPPIEADPDAVAQALLNLINNAVKYSEHDKFLSVEVDHETRRGRRGVLISVRDRGIGIRPEDRARLFDGFFRAPDERVRQRRGAGLGLALVKHIVDAHHGSIDVESRLVKGSTFRIFLPEVGPAPAPEKS
jgi:signal transduction histidine kinase